MYDVDILIFGGRHYEVFMDDLSVVGDSFDRCLSDFVGVLKSCKYFNLVLN